MPGNELGDGVHNFFVRDNPFQGQQQSQAPEGNWPILNSTFSGGGGAGSGEYPFIHGSPLIQSATRPGSANGSEEQPLVNGFVYGNQSLQTRQSLDLFGGQHHTGLQQPNMPHFLQPRNSGINEMPQLLQQQLMIRKLQEQELQRKQHVSRQDYSNQAPPSVAKQSTSNSSSFQNPLSAEYDAKWLHRGHPNMHDSSNGLAFQLNTGDARRSMDFPPQQFDQSLYGFPVSNSRGLPETQYPQMMADRYLMPQPQLTIASSSSLHGNEGNSLADRVGAPDESSVLMHDFHSQKNTEIASRQSINTGMKNRVAHQRVNSLSRNVAQETFKGKHQSYFHSETSSATSTGQVSSPKNGSSLDPEEEKILFGSDDNIWGAFGNVHQISGEPGKMIDNGGLFDALPSIQSGSWSALMQSAVAETSSNDAILQEQNSGIFHNGGNSARQISSMHNDTAEKVKSSSENNMRMQVALNSGSFTADNVEIANTMAFNQSGIEIQQEPGYGVHTETSHNFVRPLLDDRYHFCSNPLQTSVASQHHNQPERDTKKIMSGETTTRIQGSWNGMASMPPGMERFSNHGSQKLKQLSQNTRDNLMHGKISSSGEQNPLLCHTNESVRVKSEAFNPGSRRVDDASLVHANNAKKIFNTGPFLQTQSLFNQWRSAVSPTTSRDSKGSDSLLNQTNQHNQISDSMIKHNEDDAARCEEGKSVIKNNINDICYSNLSHHTSHGFREGGSSSTNKPRSPTPAEQNPTNDQFSNKGSTSRKFLYHPMGNVDEDVEAGHKLRKPVAVRASSQQTHFSDSNLYGSNSVAIGKGQPFEFSRHGEDGGNESLNKNPSRLALNLSSSTSQATDTNQNMLELLHKVDETKDHTGTMQTRLSKDNVRSQPPDPEKSFNIHCLQSQSSVSQGFGLHLGPPSQRMQISQNSSRPSMPFSTADGSATLETGGSENPLHKLPGNICAGAISDIPSSKSHLHDKKSAKPGIQKSINLFNDPFRGNSSDNLAAPDMPEQIGKNDFREEIIPSSTVPVKDYEGTSHHFSMSGSSQQRDSATMPFNIWSNVPVHHNSGQRQLVPSQNSHSQFRNVLESSSSPMQHLEESKSKESLGQQSQSVSTDRIPKIEVPKGKEPDMKDHLLNSPSNSTSVLKEIEDFGRYLRPNSFSDQTYSLPKRTQPLKDKYGDSEKTDRLDNLADATPASSEPLYVVPQIIAQRDSITSYKDMWLNPSVSESHTYGDSVTFPRVEHHQVSTQMAPTWVSAHESSKGGQTLQVCNEKELSHVKTGESPLPLGKSHIGSNAPNSEEMRADATLAASVNHHCSSSLPQVNVTGQNLVLLQQKKRKSAMLEPQPWHKEISDDSDFLGILSINEPGSSKAANRVNGVAETTEDANRVLRSKQRLITSSHLMQQLIRAPPPSVPLSIDATTSYDIVAYSVSRIAIGDACHAVSYANNLKGSHSSANPLSDKRKSPTKARELIGKVTKLENDLSRLEKSASLLGLRLECQELEKFTTINRFARFHGRGQNDTSAAANATLKFPAQRYVIPVAMPRNLPETVNCLQL